MAKCLLLALLPLLAEGGGHANATASNDVSCIGGSFSLNVDPTFEANAAAFNNAMKDTVKRLMGDDFADFPVEQIHVEMTFGEAAVQDNCAAAYVELADAVADLASATTAAPAATTTARSAPSPSPPSPSPPSPSPPSPSPPAGTTTAAAVVTTTAAGSATTLAATTTMASMGPSDGPSDGPSAGPGRRLGAHQTENAHVGYAVVALASEIADIRTTLSAVEASDLSTAFAAAVAADDTITDDLANLVAVDETSWAALTQPVTPAPAPAPSPESPQDNFALRSSLSLVGLVVVSHFVIV